MNFQCFTTLASTAGQTAARPAEPEAQFITDVIIDNSSETPTSVSIRDGQNGPTIARFPCPDGSGVVKTFKTPLKVSAGNALIVQCADAIDSVYVTLLGEIKHATQE